MKIVYCLDSINYVGGIQHVTVTKANALALRPGNEVWVIVADNSGPRRVLVSPTVHVINLGINYYAEDWRSKWNVLKGIFIKRRKHRKALEAVLEKIQPDILISVGQSEKNFLPSIRGPWRTIREFHFVKPYRRFHAHTAFDHLLARGGDLIDRFVLKKYDRIVILTQEDKVRNWRPWKSVSVIPNPAPSSSRYASLVPKRIVAIGRLAYPKNFSSLIRSFAIVVRQFPDWTLDIFGEGEERKTLLSEIRSLDLNASVRLMGSTSDVPSILPSYSLFAMSSRFEGFPLVLVEALSCGLPVVSYACPCGPRDIIRDGVDGFLVPPGDETLLAERICQLIEDENLRRRMGTAAQERAKEFSLEKVIPMWTSLFEELVKEKKK